MNRKAFERVVREAIEELPERFHFVLENVAIQVEEEPSLVESRELGLDPNTDELFGLYRGVPLSERDSSYTGLPDQVVIFREPLLRHFKNHGELRQQIKKTVIHELGHHLGMSDDEMAY